VRFLEWVFGGSTEVEPESDFRRVPVMGNKKVKIIFSLAFEFGFLNIGCCFDDSRLIGPICLGLWLQISNG
jgi:hypothetical protein